jgi:hypothetical protein
MGIEKLVPPPAVSSQPRPDVFLERPARAKGVGPCGFNFASVTFREGHALNDIGLFEILAEIEEKRQEPEVGAHFTDTVPVRISSGTTEASIACSSV